jgi:SAM-dependent methyltransferase
VCLSPLALGAALVATCVLAVRRPTAAAEPALPHPVASGDAPPDATCLLCGGGTRRLFAARGHWIRVCVGCGHRVAELTPGPDHVARIYGDGYFTGQGDGYADYLDEAPLLRAHGERYAALLRPYVRPGRVLDVGTAAGFVLEGLRRGGWSGAGLEPNRRMAALASERLGIPVHATTLEEFRADDQFDLVTMLQVLPHLVDVRRALANASAATAAGGWWLIESWNRDAPSARLLGRRWHEYNPPSVLRWFTPREVRQLAAEYGFVEVAHGRPHKRLDGAHLKALLRHHLGTDAGARWLAAAIPDRLVIPYPFGDVFWSLFRRAEGA